MCDDPAEEVVEVLTSRFSILSQEQKDQIRVENQRETAGRMLAADRFTLEEIAVFSNLDLSEVRALAAARRSRTPEAGTP